MHCCSSPTSPGISRAVGSGVVAGTARGTSTRRVPNVAASTNWRQSRKGPGFESPHWARLPGRAPWRDGPSAMRAQAPAEELSAPAGGPSGQEADGMHNSTIFMLALIATIVLLAAARFLFARPVIKEYETGLLYRNGHFRRR